MSHPGQSRSRPRNTAAKASDSVDVVPKISRKPLKKRRRLSRDRFDALYLASRKVDAGLLQQVDPEMTTEGSDTDKLTNRMAERIRLNRGSMTSLLVSLATHLALILVLLLLLTVANKEEPSIDVEAAFFSTPIELDSKPEETPDKIKIEVDIEKEVQSTLQATAEDMSTDTVDEMANQVQQVPSPTLATESNPISLDAKPHDVGSLPTRPTGGGLQGRNANNRAKLAGSRGGTKGSEIAVERGLRWIAQHQRPDGSWRFFHNVNACQGDCRNPGKIESPTAATGLALMSMLGAGYTHQAGPYQRDCLLYTSPSPRDRTRSRMPSSA